MSGSEVNDIGVEELSRRLRAGLEIKDRSYHLKPYRKCFLGSDAVKFLVREGVASNTDDALSIGNALIQEGIFHHVTKDHVFKDEDLFYRFKADEEGVDHGSHELKADGSIWSWADYLLGYPASKASPETLQAALPNWDDSGFVRSQKDVGVAPLDQHNIKLLDNVHPAKWRDPDPQPKYNLVVIGAGAGGLVTAAGAAGVGGKVAIIEEHLMGGDCLNVGCVPSKALIRCARAAHQARTAARFGVHIGEVSVDFGAVMERMRKLRADISPLDSSHRFAEELGVDVFQGRAWFTSPHTVEVNGKTLRFAAAVIATGGTARIPPIAGIQDVPYLTNASIFNLTELPKRFGVIGTGPIGLELAQCMARFGSKVTVFGRSGRILEKEDTDAASIVQEALEADGIELMAAVEYRRVSQQADGAIRVVIVPKGGGKETVVEVDALLVATGRSPNVSGMGLETAGVAFDTTHGIQVNDMLQTSAKHIFAVGDCCTQYQFTHVADFMARSVIRNALFFGKAKMSSLLIPWATYTEPEVAHVGLYPRDLEKRGIKFQTYRRDFEHVDRAILDGETEGFVKIHTKAGSDKILGATIVAHDAGNMISEISVAMQAGMGLGSLAAVIHPYPTQSEAIRQAGDAYNRTRLTPFVKSLFRNLLAFQRR